LLERNRADCHSTIATHGNHKGKVIMKMRFFLRTTIALTFCSPLFLALNASAATAGRGEVQMAAGLCQPFVPTNDIRYSATGMRNAGTGTLYAICSMAGTWYENDQNGGSSLISVKVRNTAATPQSVSCTARPGYAYGATNNQLSMPLTRTIQPGSYQSFTWLTGDAGGRMRNPNFTCTLKPGIEIQYAERSYTEDVGT
jgi:hypothetical protein